MQAVLDDEAVERDVLGRPPVAHDRVAAEHRDVGGLRNVLQHADHGGGVGALHHGRRILRVHQDHVDAGRLEAGEALAHQVGLFRHAFLVDDGVGADLPEDEIGTLCEHAAVEAREHFPGVLAAHAAIDDLDPHVGILLAQLDLEPAGIAVGARGGADALGR